MSSKFLIAFSLYGSNPLYTVGALRNAETVGIHYPGWRIRFYVNETVPAEIIKGLRERGAELVEIPGKDNCFAAFWRFEAFADTDLEVCLMRDCDSRFSEREAAAVKEWVASGKDFHIMRDHPGHHSKILAGMWGARTSAMRDIKQLLAQHLVGQDFYGKDQYFLGEHIYPCAKKSAVIHDEFFRYEKFARSFPLPRADGEFVGERIDENEEPEKAQRVILQRGLSPRQRRRSLWNYRLTSLFGEEKLIRWKEYLRHLFFRQK